MSLPDALEAAAGALPAYAEAIRPANGDPARLLASLEPRARAELLAWLLAQRSDDGEQLAEAWSDDAGGRAALLAIEEAALPKEGRKRLRRLRHRLRSRGVVTPEPAPAPTVARLPELEDPLGGAFVTPCDPVGVRNAWWLEPHPSGGTRLFEASFDDARGILAFEVYSAGRSQVRRFVKQLGAHEHFPALAVEPAAVKALVRWAAARQGDRSAPKRWIEWRARLGSDGEARLPGELVAEALGGAHSRESLERAAELVTEGSVGPWPPPREVIAPVVERLQNALESPLVVSGATKREQVARLLAEAAGEVFAGDAGTVAAHRFRESAFVFWRQGNEGDARACLAAADAFASRPAAENQVAHAFLELWLRPLLAAATGRAPPDAPEQREPSLLVRP